MRISCTLPIFRTALVAFASLAVAATSLQGQRLPSTVVPQHYALALTPDLHAATFSGIETINVILREPSRTITLNANELDFQSVAISAAGTRPDRNRLARSSQRTGHLHRRRSAARRPGRDHHSLHRHPQRRAPRLLSLQNQSAATTPSPSSNPPTHAAPSPPSTSPRSRPPSTSRSSSTPATPPSPTAPSSPTRPVPSPASTR